MTTSNNNNSIADGAQHQHQQQHQMILSNFKELGLKANDSTTTSKDTSMMLTTHEGVSCVGANTSCGSGDFVGGASTRYVVRMRGLPWSAREREIRKFFWDEKVKKVKVVFVDEGRSSGEAFVEFETAQDYKSGLAKNHQYISQRYIELFEAAPQSMDNIPEDGFVPDYFPSSSSLNQNQNQNHLQQPQQPQQQQQQMATPRMKFMKRAGCKDVLRIRGLPYKADEADVRYFFYPVVPVAVHLITDDVGRKTGEGFAEFASEFEAYAALSKHGSYLGHRYVELFWSTPHELENVIQFMNENQLYMKQYKHGKQQVKTQSHHQQPQQQQQQQQAKAGNKHHKKYNVRNSKCLFLSGLPMPCTQQDIVVFFEALGVSPVRIHHKVEGEDAFVEFMSSFCADMAMKGNGLLLGNKVVNVTRVSYEQMAKAVGLNLSGQQLQLPLPVLPTTELQEQESDKSKTTPLSTIKESTSNTQAKTLSTAALSVMAPSPSSGVATQLFNLTPTPTTSPGSNEKTNELSLNLNLTSTNSKNLLSLSPLASLVQLASMGPISPHLSPMSSMDTKNTIGGSNLLTPFPIGTLFPKSEETPTSPATLVPPTAFSFLS